MSMTKKQEEAIRICEERIIKPFYEFPNPTSIELKDIDVEEIETVLNMLKEKDKLINEQLKENVSLQKELNEENKRCMILANNDKFKEQIIDLMAEYIAALDIEEDICIKTGKNLNECDSMAIGECEECIKQYFERKSKE